MNVQGICFSGRITVLGSDGQRIVQPSIEVLREGRVIADDPDLLMIEVANEHQSLRETLMEFFKEKGLEVFWQADKLKRRIMK